MVMATLAAQTVGKLMRSQFIALAPEESLLEADRIMRLARIRHLPITRKGILVGVISHRDILAASIARLEERPPAERLEHLRRIPIADVMRNEPYTATLDTTLGEAAQRMLRLKIGCLPVVRPTGDGPELVGLVTESDLLRAAYAPDFRGASD
jgi:CBS domain-containing membrane protein